MMEGPQSCDTFVVLPPLSSCIVFGKNSDRPQGEVQEVVLIPREKSSGKVKCTYIEVDIENESFAVILSKPGWMWGAEMGANEYNVAIGNEAVWTTDESPEADPSVKRLLGMDLVRLGLQYGRTAEGALDIIAQFLARYGQGGPCSDTDTGLCYHNSFLIADPQCAWVLETVGKHWAAEKISDGYRNISNALTITTKIDRMSDGLVDYCKQNGFWSGEGVFNFAESFSSNRKPGCERQFAGEKLLKKHTIEKSFTEKEMFMILRDKKSDICREVNSAFPTQGSQVSTLSKNVPSIHWFTATPDPSKSVFKPFVFRPNAKVSLHTRCPENDPSKPHNLYSLHGKVMAKNNNATLSLLRSMEEECIAEIAEFLSKPITEEKLDEFNELFKDCVETEVKFYR